MPKVSVIMPVYNKAVYVEKAIYSVLDQSMDDLELIVVNDGSTDRSLSIVQRIALRDNRVHVLDVPNGGVSRARNIGLEHSSGEWIQFLDADDWLEPEYLTKAMQALQLNPADILFSGFSMVDEQMTLVKEIALPEAGIVDQEGLCRQFIRYQRENGFFGYISNKLFRRSVWLQSGAVFPVGTRLAEDLHFYARLYPAVTKALFWQGKSFRYLQTSANYTHNTDIDYYSQIEIHLDIKAWFEKSMLYEEYRHVLDGVITGYAYYILFDENERKKELSEAFSWLTNRGDIMQSLMLDDISVFEKSVLWCLSRRSLLGIRMLFACRNGVRALYRIVKRS